MDNSVRRQRPLLGTLVEVGVLARGDAAQRGIERAFEVIAALERRLSFQSPTSELTCLNRHPGQPVTLHPVTCQVLRLARATMRASGGLFDCTVGAALVERGVLPDHGGPAPLRSGACDDIELHGCSACLRRPIRVTLDGIAKGFAVDAAIAALRTCGIVAGWINAGGDLRAFGALSLPVGRRDESHARSALGYLHDAALATSRVGPPDAARPGLVVAGAIGVPAPGTWTVMARRAWRADALTKVAALAPAASRAALVARLGGRLIGTAAAARAA